MPRVSGSARRYALAGELTRREAALLAREPWSIAAIVIWEIAKLAELGRIEVDLDDPELTRMFARNSDLCRLAASSARHRRPSSSCMRLRNAARSFG